MATRPSQSPQRWYRRLTSRDFRLVFMFKFIQGLGVYVVMGIVIYKARLVPG